MRETALSLIHDGRFPVSTRVRHPNIIVTEGLGPHIHWERVVSIPPTFDDSDSRDSREAIKSPNFRPQKGVDLPRRQRGGACSNICNNKCLDLIEMSPVVAQ
jgi:hypothetical protein